MPRLGRKTAAEPVSSAPCRGPSPERQRTEQEEFQRYFAPPPHHWNGSPCGCCRAAVAQHLRAGRTSVQASPLYRPHRRTGRTAAAVTVRRRRRTWGARPGPDGSRRRARRRRGARRGSGPAPRSGQSSNSSRGRRVRRPEVHRPPTGVAVAALLVFGLRYWPGIVLGTLGVVLSLTSPRSGRSPGSAGAPVPDRFRCPGRWRSAPRRPGGPLRRGRGRGRSPRPASPSTSRTTPGAGRTGPGSRPDRRSEHPPAPLRSPGSDTEVPFTCSVTRRPP